MSAYALITDTESIIDKEFLNHYLGLILLSVSTAYTLISCPGKSENNSLRNSKHLNQ